MVKQRYYQILLLLGSLLTAPLYAAEQKSQEDADYKNEEAQQHVSTKSLYEHGDLTFIDREKNKINQKELKQGLINLSRRIKAKDGRKVYFFIGAIAAGKSLSIVALQGNKVHKVAAGTLASDALPCAWQTFRDAENTLQKAPFKVTYVLPKNQVPVVGDGCTGQTKSTYIYYPDPKKLQAFADTEGFFGKREATSTQKCLSATSLFYTLKVNKIGGLVLVLSGSYLDATREKRGLRLITDILQPYFAKAISKYTIKESLLVMITKVDGANSYGKALENVRKVIQSFYQTYYTEINHEQKYNNLQEKHTSLAKQYAIIIKQLNGLKEEEKKLAQEIKKLQEEDKSEFKKYNDMLAKHKSITVQLTNIGQRHKALDEKRKNIDKAYENVQQTHKNMEKNHRLKLFFEMLLEKDVPKDKINHLNNFTLDKKRFCTILPWEEKSVQKILDKRLKSLRPIPSKDLCSFNSPILQYMQDSICGFSIELNQAIKPLLVLKQQISSMERQIGEKQNKKVSTSAYNTLIGEYQKLTKLCKEKTTVLIEAWEATAHMLRFFVNNVLEDRVNKALIKAHLMSFGAATQLKAFLPVAEAKSNNQQNKPRLAEENGNCPALASEQPGADENKPNDHPSDDIFDID